MQFYSAGGVRGTDLLFIEGKKFLYLLLIPTNENSDTGMLIISSYMHNRVSIFDRVLSAAPRRWSKFSEIQAYVATIFPDGDLCTRMSCAF